MLQLRAPSSLGAIGRYVELAGEPAPSPMEPPRLAGEYAGRSVRAADRAVEVLALKCTESTDFVGKAGCSG